MGKEYFNKAICLVCEHTEKNYHSSKEEYQEVTVCPKCNGAFVDMWKLGKYEKHINQHKECEHKYQVLNSETISFYADGGQTIQDVSATFYCEKCLDITQREQRISKGYCNVKDNRKQSGGTIKSVGTVTHRSYC